VAAPIRRGFGTRLIERTLTQDLGGGVQLTYEPAGAMCVMDVPLGDAADGQDPRASGQVAGQTGPLPALS
ncbi:MAG TPA: hypothetical protein VHN20_16400, partial [Beijerinckiaceae bacterium]|nr:hypothetical protein [Beijerinckiaceae bacterium]